MIRYFKLDAYKCYRALWFLWGLFGTIEPLAHFIQRKPTSLETLIVTIALAWALPLLLPVLRHRGYLAIDQRSNQLLIGRVLWRVTLPLSEIVRLRYSANYYTAVLLIEYVTNGGLKTQKYNVEFFNTETISEFNEAIIAMNPVIHVEIDDESKQKQEKDRNLHLKAPTTKAGWVAFAIRWFVLGALLQTVLFLLLAPKH